MLKPLVANIAMEKIAHRNVDLPHEKPSICSMAMLKKTDEISTILPTI